MWGGAAISNDTAKFLGEECRGRDPKTIVELGTGEGRSLSVVLESTTQAAVWTVDDGLGYLESARSRLKGKGLDLSRVTFIHAPLAQYQGYRWYSSAPLQAIPDQINLLVVDGPIGQVGREPALDFFQFKLAPRAVILLDDCRRKEETAILKKWSSLLGSRNVRHLCETKSTDRGLGRIELLA